MSQNSPTVSYNSTERRTTWVTILLVIVIVLSIWELISATQFLSAVSKLDKGYRTLSPIEGMKLLDDMEKAADQADAASLLRWGAWLVFLFPFLMWIHRAYGNLPALGVGHTRFSPGVVVVGFFVPLVNFILPPWAMAEIWQGSAPNNKRSGWLVAFVWWLPFVGLWVLLRYRGGLTEPSQLDWKGYVDYANRWVNTTRLYDVVIILFALVTIVVVRRVTSDQAEKWWQRSSQQRIREEASPQV